MTKGKTTLIPKDPLKGTAPNNYRPITSLLVTWKILTAQIWEKIYNSMISCRIFLEEQKGCHKRTRSTGELLYIDQHILNESKTRRKNVAMAWIDNKKAYDMVHQSWILHCLKRIKYPTKSYRLSRRNLENEIDSRRKKLSIGKDPKGIFLGNALSLLLFVIAMMSHNHILWKCTAGYKLSKSQEKINHLMYMDDIKLFAKSEKELETLTQTVRIYSQDIGMGFCIEKCIMLIMKSGKRYITEGVELSNQVVIRRLGRKENLQILGDIGS